MFSKGAIVIVSTSHVRLVEPMDGDSWIWRTNCAPQTDNRPCNLKRKKNIWKPTEAELQIKMGDLEKELQELAKACRAKTYVASLRFSRPANQRQKQPQGSTLLTPESHASLIVSTAQPQDITERNHCRLSSSELWHQQPFSSG